MTPDKQQETSLENEVELERSSEPASGEGPDQEAAQKEKVNIATFRGIPKKLHETIKTIAGELGVSPGELARYFLETGLARLTSGEEEIQPSFVPGGYTLYPDERRQRTRRKTTRKLKALQQPRSYYGVPREVVKAVLERSQLVGVTQGELVRYLFEQGVSLYRSGQLTLNPVPVQQIATLYPEDLG